MNTMDPSRRNVLMLIPNLCFGGAQTSFNSLANELNINNNVIVCVFNTIEGVAHVYNTKVIDLKIPAGKNALLKVYRFWQRYKAVKRLKSQLNIDTCISYLEGANYVNVLTKRKDRVVLSVRGSKYHDDNIKGLNGVLRKKVYMPFLYRFACHIVALNHGIKTELVNGLGVKASRISVIRNFYNTALIQQKSKQIIPQKYQRLFDHDYLIYVGRLAPEKGLHAIIDTFKILNTTKPDLKLVLVGDGPIRHELITHARSNALTVYTNYVKSSQSIGEEQIVILGYQNNPYNFIKNGTILLIASSAEGGPNVLLESMICETLVVSSDCPYGPKEQIEPCAEFTELDHPFYGKHGVLLPMITRDNYDSGIKEWAEAISYLIKDCAARDAIVERARKWALEQTPEKVLGHWEQII